MPANYASELCECGAPALVLVLNTRGHVCAAGCAEHAGGATASALRAGKAGDRYVIRTNRQKVTR